jgi:hypothetical protein
MEDDDDDETVLLQSIVQAWTRHRWCVFQSLTLFFMFLFLYKRKQTIETAYANGQAVMGRANHKLGKLLSGSPEDRCFRAFFGMSAQVSVTAWMMMEEENFSPPILFCGRSHLCLAFMRAYPANDCSLSRLLGGKDPKTINKYVWPFIRSLFLLNKTVVCLLFDCCLLILIFCKFN